ncbi:hypothetical protein SAMN05880558_111127 [Aeromonas sp. RU39B]|nr:hypothetical protein SAMN05880558_111127 [Aeromonas sp. RU39B]
MSNVVPSRSPLLPEGIAMVVRTGMQVKDNHSHLRRQLFS